MEACEQTRFDVLYAQHLRALKLQGKAEATVDGYARAVRRVAAYFDRCPDQLTTEDFKHYFGKGHKDRFVVLPKLTLACLRRYWREHRHPELLFPGNGTRKLKAELGQCAVLHTHNRRLDVHPHVHIVVPGGGIDAKRKQWRKLKGKYLFNAFALAKVFRAKLLHQLSAAGLSIPVGMPKKWIVDCRNVGTGEPALKYLSRYLYRGVIREKDLISYDANTGIVCFQYIDAITKKPAHRQLLIAEFLWCILQHVLPSGLRRVRDYGFLQAKPSYGLSSCSWFYG